MRWICAGTAPDGSSIEDTVDAASEVQAIQRLQGRGITVVRITLAPPPDDETAESPPRRPSATAVAPTAVAHPASSEPAAPPTTSPATPAAPPTKQVFISHSSEDAEAANEIVRALEEAGVTCWIAPRDIPVGGEWNHYIMTALHECKVLLLLYSRCSVDSDPVTREVERAKARGARIVPVRLDQTPPSPALEYMISAFQWIDAIPPPVYRRLPAIVAGVQQALGTTAAVRPTKQTGELKYVGRYRIMEKLGEGGMGTVYKAEQRDPVKRVVALKIVKAGFDTTEVIGRFESERQALSRMNHPNIARVLDAGATEHGRPYFVMEFIPGMPITQFADINKLSIRARLEMFLQLCDAIAHAHSKQILHRDIKSGNVLALMVDDKPVVKVIDFGIAKALVGEKLSEHTVNTNSGTAVGTYASMSPEQAEGSADLDTRSDVYSLGVLLYELLAGAKPFDPEVLKKASDAEARRMIREDQPPKPSTKLTSLGAEAEHAAVLRQSHAEALRRDLSGELGWIPMMAMRKERQRRYASPLIMAEDIENYLHARPLIAGPESKAYRMRKFIVRNRTILSTAAVAVICAGVGIGFYIHDIRAAERKTQAALTEATKQKEIAQAEYGEANRAKEKAQEAEADAKHQQQIAENALDESIKQQKIAEADTDILTTILSSANPKRGGELTILQGINVFTNAFEENPQGFGDQPQVTAAIFDTIGEAYRALGQYPRADDNLGKALEMYTNALAGAPGDVEYATILDDKAHLLKDEVKGVKPPLTGELRKRKLNDALNLYNQALKIFDQKLSPDDLHIAQTLTNRATLQLDLDKSEKSAKTAEADFNRALKIRQDNVGLHKLDPDGEEIIQSMADLVTVWIDEHRFDDASEEAETVLQMARDAQHPIKTSIALAYLCSGDVRVAQAKEDQANNDLASAERGLRDAEQQYVQAYNLDKEALNAYPDHPYFDNCRKRSKDCIALLNSVLKAENKPAEADPLLNS